MGIAVHFPLWVSNTEQTGDVTPPLEFVQQGRGSPYRTVSHSPRGPQLSLRTASKGPEGTGCVKGWADGSRAPQGTP